MRPKPFYAHCSVARGSDATESDDQRNAKLARLKSGAALTLEQWFVDCELRFEHHVAALRCGRMS
jgi:hypothetical protein